ncbi:AhpD family alkylhydroperoxidase [Aquimarina sp. EL_43]|uniref:carboxymuconolactone decarboxylase family protein n=1 Tax=unclassified Aquimarina TaxID=2627091 RepID=UPI0018C9FDFE|nr:MULTISPECIES: carboxymuconolactone decarboxylase family protein [unclassified Aquimarina]MBG6130506.1 AhpD family alkylhydroperoxidase [Aquimarina sp. EL_35]MBG6149286.1 AhpD family alkylhydroperoxidase [Aquimarina sp. EL_32]MBG6168340.1 AhpD family alkylhydroperoxidase [Aquimarina sp. EL_43]
MEKRIQIDVSEPLAYKAMYTLGNYVRQSQLSDIHKELINIRVSQLNGCAFCINMHTKDALENGETQQRIFLLDAWQETDIFTEEEKVILQVTEEVTMIHNKGLTTKTYQKAIENFDEKYVSQIIMAIININAWNRIAISTHKPIDQ